MTDDIAQRLAALEARTTGVEAGVTALETAVQELRADLRETNRSIVQLNAEMNQRFAQAQSETNARFAQAQSETNARFDAGNARIGELQQALSARIERVFWAVVAASVVIGGGIIAPWLPSFSASAAVEVRPGIPYHPIPDPGRLQGQRRQQTPRRRVTLA